MTNTPAAASDIQKTESFRLCLISISYRGRFVPGGFVLRFRATVEVSPQEVLSHISPFFSLKPKVRWLNDISYSSRPNSKQVPGGRMIDATIAENKL